MKALFCSKQVWLVVIVVFLSMALFLGLSVLSGGLGFPLDDGWIHQTYARNFARNGRFEYLPGVVSAGSTSPLWTVMLAVGYVLRLPYLLWAYLLGGVSLLWLALTSMRLWQLLWPDWADKSWLPGVVIALAWPLIWAAASGMETILFAALGMQIVVMYAQLVLKSQADSPPSMKMIILLGVLSGLLILVRPDGLVLLLLVVIGLLLLPSSWAMRVKVLLVYGWTAVIPILPYFAFNLYTSGFIWPNTFYAKQTEYRVLLAELIASRVIRLLYFSVGGAEQGWQGISGVQLLLLPGLILSGVLAVKSDWRRKGLLYTVLLLWAGGHVVLYAWRLPVTYQHGRYLFAAIPIWIIYGLAGWLGIFERVGNGRFGSQYLLVPAKDSGSNHDIAITQKDINEIQLAKGAINAGLNILLEVTDTAVEEVEEVIIAGAFGSFLDVKNAIAMGLFPRLPKATYRQVGNAALIGAKWMLVSQEARQRAQQITDQTIYQELTTYPKFSRHFALGMLFPRPED